MVGHEYVRRDGDTVAMASIRQTLEVEMVILFGKETGLSVIAPLYDMAGHTG
jgi:hypothetical protein